jgi:hypothetical protein
MLVLHSLSSDLLLSMNSPLRVGQFLLTQLEQGSLDVKISCLSGLILLITRFNLDLPDFYERLLAILAYTPAQPCFLESRLL